MASKSDRTRQFIIEQAAPLFNTKGYAATSMSDIMEVTGLAKGGLYGNFESKDQLAKEALIFSFNELNSALRAKTRQETTYKGKLLAILDFYKNYTTHPVIEGGCPLLNAAIDADDQLPFLREVAHQFLKDSLSAITAIIAKGKVNGEFKPDLNAADEAEWIFATLEGGIMMSKLAGTSKILNRLLDRIISEVNIKYSR